MARNFLIILNILQQEFKTASKRAIQKTTEPTGNLIGNKLLITLQKF